MRDIYDLGDRLLIVVTDRISAYDVIMNEGIPSKGRVLNKISEYWFKLTEDIVPNHMISTNVGDYPTGFREYSSQLEGRSMLVEKADTLPVECVVRGYLAGSGWKEYSVSQSVCGVGLPSGLKESSKLGAPIFTPATKAELGDHDENISFEKTAELIGRERAEQVRETSISLYLRASEIADGKGIIIADTKFEFGTDNDGNLILIDEALTPDSSRFWPKDGYLPGGPQPSFDKQYVRDYLTSTGWDRVPPPPRLPADVIIKTSEKYREAYSRLTGSNLD